MGKSVKLQIGRLCYQRGSSASLLLIARCILLSGCHEGSYVVFLRYAVCVCMCVCACMCACVWALQLQLHVYYNNRDVKGCSTSMIPRGHSFPSRSSSFCPSGHRPPPSTPQWCSLRNVSHRWLCPAPQPEREGHTDLWNGRQIVATSIYIVASSPGLPRPKSQLWILGRGTLEDIRAWIS